MHFLSVSIRSKWHWEKSSAMLSRLIAACLSEIYTAWKVSFDFIRKKHWASQLFSLAKMYFSGSVRAHVRVCVFVCAGAELDGINLCNMRWTISKLILPRRTKFPTRSSWLAEILYVMSCTSPKKSEPTGFLPAAGMNHTKRSSLPLLVRGLHDSPGWQRNNLIGLLGISLLSLPKFDFRISSQYFF